jgi:hypothetical protein
MFRVGRSIVGRRGFSSVIEPKFWQGYDAFSKSAFTVDGGGKLHKEAHPPADLLEELKDVYSSEGCVHLVNTGLTDLAEMQKYIKHVQGKQIWYEGGANRREALQKGLNVYEVGAPAKAWLHYHHEMAYNAHSIQNLGFCCKKATPGKGATFVSEQTSVTDLLLQMDVGKKLKEKGVTYIRCLTDRDFYSSRYANREQENTVYNHWQISFGVDTPEEAEKMATACGLEWEWVSDPLHPENERYLKTSINISAFEYAPTLDRNILFSSVADHHMWFDRWPGVMELPAEKRPLTMTYGDGSEITEEDRANWVHAYDTGGIKIPWAVGDCVVVCNYRYAHGRPDYHLEAGEERELGVCIGPKFGRIGQDDSKW